MYYIYSYTYKFYVPMYNSNYTFKLNLFILIYQINLRLYFLYIHARNRFKIFIIRLSKNKTVISFL